MVNIKRCFHLILFLMVAVNLRSANLEAQEEKFQFFLTQRCAEKLNELREGLPQYKIIEVQVALDASCTGIRYDLNFAESKPDGTIEVESRGIKIVVDKDAIAFLNKTKLDYVSDQAKAGFKFENPNQLKLELLPEYKARMVQMRAEEKKELERDKKIAAQIDPAKELKALTGDDPDQAFRRLQVWWKVNQPDTDSMDGALLGHLEKYTIDGEQITVVFSGEKGKADGGVCLIDSEGKQIPIFQYNNYIEEPGQFRDVNGDGVPEIIAENSMGGRSLNNSNRVVTDTTSVDFIPISKNQQPLLRLLFDNRPFGEAPSWSWKTEKKNGEHSIVLHEEVDGQDVERTRFVWSKEKARFEGPMGSIKDGFIANAGDFKIEDVETFIRPRK